MRSMIIGFSAVIMMAGCSGTTPAISADGSSYEVFSLSRMLTVNNSTTNITYTVGEVNTKFKPDNTLNTRVNNIIKGEQW